MLCAAASITVFINGVATEVPRGPIDLRSMFGQDVMLVHSTGGVLPVNEYGILTQSLQMGENYFSVSSSSSCLAINLISIFNKQHRYHILPGHTYAYAIAVVESIKFYA
jgi:hypothetical protein